MSEIQIEAHEAPSDRLRSQESERTHAVGALLADFQGERNLIGIYDLLLRIDRRVNPHLYAEGKQAAI